MGHFECHVHPFGNPPISPNYVKEIPKDSLFVSTKVALPECFFCFLRFLKKTFEIVVVLNNQFRGLISNLYRGYNHNPFTKYQQDIPV